MKRRSRPPGGLRRLARHVALAGVFALVLATVLYAAAWFYLPAVVAQKADIEAWLTDAARHPVRFEQIESYWDGLNPGVRIWGVTVYGEDGRRPSVRVAEAEVSFAPLPLLWGEVHIHRLVLVRPALALERRSDGRIQVVGLAPPPDSRPGTGAAWLLGQARVAVREGEARWTDARDPGRPLLLSHIELSLRNLGERHRLAASASFPRALCRECSVAADITGDPLAGSWDGQISIRAKALDVHALPMIARERLPAELRGRFDVQLRSDWRSGRPQSARGEVAVTELRLPLGGERRPLALRQAAVDGHWRTTDEGWRLDLAQLTLGIAGKSWSAGRVQFEQAAESLLEIERVELDDLTALVAAYQPEHPWLRRWTGIQPSGVLHGVKVKMQGALAAPGSFEAQARIAGLRTAAHERVPGLRGLSGRISLDATAGTFDIDSHDVSLDLPAVFRQPIDAGRATGTVRWRKTEAAWRITGSDLRVQSDDGSGSGTLALDMPHDRARSPVLRLRADFRDGNGARAPRYYPVQRLKPRTLAWMESAFAGGRIVSGHLVYDGPVREFPFEAGQGRFEIRARVRDGTYRYLPGWTPLTQVEADVAIDGADAVITGRGRIGALQARDIRVEVMREQDGPRRTVRVKGQVDGPVAETVRVLQAVEAKSAAWRERMPDIAQAEGSGALDLDVRVPLKSERRPSFLATYRFTDAALKLASGIALEAANGIVGFSDAGLRESRVQARLFGGPLVFAAARGAGGLRVHAEGSVLLSELLQGRRAIAERVSGGIDWSLAWQDRSSGPQLRFEADLSGARTRLPPPLDKGAGGLVDPLTVTTESSRPDALVLAVNAGPALSGKLAFNRERNDWRFQKGRVEFGRSTAQLPQRTGLEIGISAEAVDVDQWLPLLDGGTRRGSLEALTGVTAEIRQLNLLNRRWGRAYLHLVRHGAEWRAVVDGDAAAGEGKFKLGAGAPSQVRLDLAYLRLPERRDARPPERPPADPRHLPALELRALSLEYKQRQLGELTLNAAPHVQGWRIDRLNLSRPEMTLAVHGDWRRSGPRESSDFNIEWSTGDMGATLDALGAPGQMVKGKAKVQAHLSWSGAPTQPTLASMNGNVEVAAEDGRFLKFGPGAARLFGLLDLRSIGRYLTLDFSPAFGKGFMFDVIHGAIAIERGNATTSDLIVKGPALSLGVVGRVGLAVEDYDLALQASPRVGSTLTLTSWGLFGPQAAAAVLALQRLFRRQIEEGTRVTYLIKGPWDNPTVTRLNKTPDNSPAAFDQAH